jgi:acylphosphatase
MTERLEATIQGIVQGVGYRWFAIQQANRLGLTGWAANQSDGSVRVVAEGSVDALNEFVVALHEGPAGAHVESVDQVRLPATGEFATFGIRSAGHRGD